MDWHRRRKIIVALFISTLVLLMLLGSATVAMDFKRGGEVAELTELRDATETATRLLVALIDIESGVADYLVTGDPAHLEPTYRGRETVDQVLDDAEVSISDWSAPGLDQTLGDLIAAQSKSVKDALDLARREGYLAAHEKQRGTEGTHPLMNQMRAIIGYKIAEFAKASDYEEWELRLFSTANATLSVVTLSFAILSSVIQFSLFRGEVKDRTAIEAVLRRRNEERRQIGELSASLLLSESRLEAYEFIAAYAKGILPELSGALYVYTASRDQLELVTHWSGPGQLDVVAERLQPSDCLGLRQGGRHSGGKDAASDQHEVVPINCRHVGGGEVGPYTCIPIVGREQILGMLHLRGEALRQPETAATLDAMIERLVDQFSLSLTNIDLREKLRNMALRDGLTGLYNRRFLDEMLEHDLAKLERESKHAALLLLDVDHFKRFNDANGHQAGDEALRRVSGALTGAVRASDVVCRYGGEEFLVFLPNCPRSEATTKAERIREAVAATQLTMGGLPLPSVTISIGVALFPDGGTTRAQLMQEADRALYRAKAAGRNCVMLADQDDWPPCGPSEDPNRPW